MISDLQMIIYFGTAKSINTNSKTQNYLHTTLTLKMYLMTCCTKSEAKIYIYYLMKPRSLRTGLWYKQEQTG